MKTILLTSLIAFLYFPINTSNIKELKSNRCTSWDAYSNTGRESELYLKICEYSSGGSGYIKFKNGNNVGVRISYKLTFYNGETQTGSTNVKAFSETSGSSCYNCAQKNSGVKYWALTKIVYEGENGYW